MEGPKSRARRKGAPSGGCRVRLPQFFKITCNDANRYILDFWWFCRSLPRPTMSR